MWATPFHICNSLVNDPLLRFYSEWPESFLLSVSLFHHNFRKLPNTRLRNDKDVQRLCDFMELELVIKGQNRLPVSRNDTQSTSKNNYKSIQGFKNQTILY